jgi:hypothetical protein
MTAAVRSLVGMRVSLTYPNCLMKFWIFVVVCAAYTDRSRRSLATWPGGLDVVLREA